MKVGVLGSLVKIGRGRPRKEHADYAQPPDPIGVGQPPWLPSTAHDIVKRQTQRCKLRRNLLALRPVKGLTEAQQRALISSIAEALNTWTTTKDALWCYYPVQGSGALGIAAEAAGKGISRPARKTLRGRKPNVADVRFLIACADTWEAVVGKRQLWRIRQVEHLNQRRGTFGSFLRKPPSVQIAGAAWASCGHNVADTLWPGLIENARHAGKTSFKNKT